MLPPHECVSLKATKEEVHLEGHPVIKKLHQNPYEGTYRLFQTGSDGARVNKVRTVAYASGRQ